MTTRRLPQPRHTGHGGPVSTDHRASEVASLIARLAELMTDQRPTEPPAPRQMPERTLLTVAEAAEQLNIGKTKTFALIKTGELESVRIGTLRRVPVSAIADYAARLVADHRANRTAA